LKFSEVLLAVSSDSPPKRNVAQLEVKWDVMIGAVDNIVYIPYPKGIVNRRFCTVNIRNLHRWASTSSLFIPFAN
jgi:hypothetical protein